MNSKLKRAVALTLAVVLVVALLASMILPYIGETGKSPYKLRTCIHNQGTPDGRRFFPSDKEMIRSHTDVWQGKATRYDGEKAAQTAFNGCEYRFLRRATAKKRGCQRQPLCHVRL